MNSGPAPTDLVLVCILPEPRDLDFARLFGWYRIPLKHAPKVIFTDYLAFYQPSSFGAGHTSMIEYYAPVRGVELVQRKDLIQDESDHPRAQEEYYKIILGDLQKLPNPIQADLWKRITFFYSTGDLLMNASTIKDLMIDRSYEKKFHNIFNDRQSRYKDLKLERKDSDLLIHEVLEYILSQNDIIKNSN